ALSCQGIEIRRLKLRPHVRLGTVEPKLVIANVVRQNDDNVRLGCTPTIARTANEAAHPDKCAKPAANQGKAAHKAPIAADAGADYAGKKQSVLDKSLPRRFENRFFSAGTLGSS